MGLCLCDSRELMGPELDTEEPAKDTLGHQQWPGTATIQHQPFPQQRCGAQQGTGEAAQQPPQDGLRLATPESCPQQPAQHPKAPCTDGGKKAHGERGTALLKALPGPTWTWRSGQAVDPPPSPSRQPCNGSVK
ncbi:unnamed protein product [Boreogadus saida]